MKNQRVGSLCQARLRGCLVEIIPSLIPEKVRGTSPFLPPSPSLFPSIKKTGMGFRCNFLERTFEDDAVKWVPRKERGKEGQVFIPKIKIPSSSPPLLPLFEFSNSKGWEETIFPLEIRPPPRNLEFASRSVDG